MKQIDYEQLYKDADRFFSEDAAMKVSAFRNIPAVGECMSALLGAIQQLQENEIEMKEVLREIKEDCRTAEKESCPTNYEACVYTISKRINQNGGLNE
jgi:hypothetical protein